MMSYVHYLASLWKEDEKDIQTCQRLEGYNSAALTFLANFFLGCRNLQTNKMKPTNPNADTYVEEQRQYFFLTLSSEPTCGTT